MKIPITLTLNDEAHEYFLNLVAQGFYGESWDLKMRLLCRFDEYLNSIIYNILLESIQKKSK
jgi:hypothetical protein